MKVASGLNNVPQAARRCFLKSFFLFHVFLIVLWYFSVVPFHNQLLNLVTPYMNLIGLNQPKPAYYPDPRTFTHYLRAEITFADGNAATWEFPRLTEKSPWWNAALGRADTWMRTISFYPACRLDTGRYIARLFEKSFNPPERITVLECWSWVRPSADKTVIPMPETREEDDHKTLFVYDPLADRLIEQQP